MLKPYYQREGITIYHGDCLDIMPRLIDAGVKVDAVVADPPYGVSLGIKANNQRFNRTQYESMDDTPDYVERICVPAIRAAVAMARCGVVTTGVKNMWLYDKPSHVGSAYYPCATGCNSWGFSNWQPLFYYGKDPFGGSGSLHDSFKSTEPAERNGHPCPKPIGQTVWMVNRVSRNADTILDPFLGSGTTAVACIRTGRKCLGIEISEKYCKIAAKRCDTEFERTALIDPVMKAEQREIKFSDDS